MALGQIDMVWLQGSGPSRIGVFLWTSRRQHSFISWMPSKKIWDWSICIQLDISRICQRHSGTIWMPTPSTSHLRCTQGVAVEKWVKERWEKSVEAIANNLTFFIHQSSLKNSDFLYSKNVQLKEVLDSHYHTNLLILPSHCFKSFPPICIKLITHPNVAQEKNGTIDQNKKDKFAVSFEYACSAMASNAKQTINYNNIYSNFHFVTKIFLT